MKKRRTNNSLAKAIATDVLGPNDRPTKSDENRIVSACPRCGKKATVERGVRVSRDGGETWIIQTIYRCWSNLRHRCKPTLEETPET